MSLIKEYIGLAVVSIILSFPIGGAIGSLAQNPLSQILVNPLGDIIVIILGSFITTMNGGFMYENEANADKTNMYPWIIPTAVIFFLLGIYKKRTKKL